MKLNYGGDKEVSLVIATFLWFIRISLCVGSPECKVVPQELHNKGGVLVWILVECVQLRDRVVESLKMTKIFSERMKKQLSTIFKEFKLDLSLIIVQLTKDHNHRGLLGSYEFR